MKSLLAILILAALIRPLSTQTSYKWNGSANSSFSNAANWTPVRQYMHSNDILIIDKGSNVTITDVNQITIGKLIIRNATQVTMSPGSGNSRVLSILGVDGDDFIIEQGSSLNISANNPRLSILIKSGATAAIFGTLSFSGNSSHGISSEVSNAIIFKTGSFLYQNNTGNVFSNSGVQNCAVFQNGSSFVYNNVNAANPFGLAAPGSKVRFEKGSNFIFGVNASSPFSVDGRSFPNLIILNGINVSISDTLTHGISMDSVIISPGSSLEIINTNNSSSGSVNINGSLQVDGTLRIGNNSAGINNIIFSGTGIQNIGGSGALDFSCSSSVFINNDIKLFRDLILNCTVNNSSAIIYSPGYRFVVKGKTLNTQPIPESTNKGTFANSISPLSYELKQNYPNPFNSQTAVEFSLASDTHVDLKLFDVTGRLVSEILSSNLSAGRHKINFDSKDISSGVYFYTINAGSFTKTLKMIVVK